MGGDPAQIGKHQVARYQQAPDHADLGVGEEVRAVEMGNEEGEEESSEPQRGQDIEKPQYDDEFPTISLALGPHPRFQPSRYHQRVRRQETAVSSLHTSMDKGATKEPVTSTPALPVAIGV